MKNVYDQNNEDFSRDFMTKTASGYQGSWSRCYLGQNPRSGFASHWLHRRKNHEYFGVILENLPKNTGLQQMQISDQYSTLISTHLS